MGQSVKTAISLQENLFKKVTKLARELKMPRSRIFSIAVEEYIKKKESEKLLCQINKAYSEETPEEKELRRKHKKRHNRMTSGESW